MVSPDSRAHARDAGPAGPAPLPVRRRPVPATVVAVRELSPALVRITVAGDGLREFPAWGRDHWLRLFLPTGGQDRPLLPDVDEWWTAVVALPDDVRPVVRSYTVRSARPADGEVDLDIVRHGDSGPGSRWAATAAVGDHVGLLDEGATFDLPADADWVLLLADESGLPALAAILESLPEGRPIVSYVEVPSRADTLHLTGPAGQVVHWLPRDAGQVPGDLLVAAVPTAELPAGAPYVWLAAEQRTVRQVRRHLVGERGYPRSAVTFMSYWNRGR